jgi:hypothetical protein
MTWIIRLVAINCRASSGGSGRCLCRAMPPDCTGIEAKLVTALTASEE